jgi:flagellar motor component MotA
MKIAPITLITSNKTKLENKIGNDFVIATYGNEIIENSKDILARMTKCQNFTETYEGEFTNIDIAFMDTKISLYYDGSMSEEDRKLLEKEIENHAESSKSSSQRIGNTQRCHACGYAWMW